MDSEDSGLEAAQRWLAEEGIPFPCMPVELQNALKPISEGVFSSRSILPATPYFTDPFIEEVETQSVDDYAVLAFDGHGMNSYAIHYYLVYGPLAFFLQVSWGGAYTDREKAQAAISSVFAKIEPIIQTAMKVDESKVSSRFILSASSFYGCRWRQLGVDEDWCEEGSGFNAALEALEKML